MIGPRALRSITDVMIAYMRSTTVLFQLWQKLWKGGLVLTSPMYLDLGKNNISINLQLAILRE